MEKRIMTFIACLFLSIGMALAQTHVSGQVTSAEDGEPIIGATVKVVGSKTAGAVTDINGNFSINAPAGAQLEITYVGMEKKTVKASNNMKIVLNNDNHSLGEVVVTGYGSARKLGTIAGSVETVSGKTLQNVPCECNASVHPCPRNRCDVLRTASSNRLPHRGEYLLSRIPATRLPSRTYRLHLERQLCRNSNPFQQKNHFQNREMHSANQNASFQTVSWYT